MKEEECITYLAIQDALKLSKQTSKIQILLIL